MLMNCDSSGYAICYRAFRCCEDSVGGMGCLLLQPSNSEHPVWGEEVQRNISDNVQDWKRRRYHSIMEVGVVDGLNVVEI